MAKRYKGQRAKSFHDIFPTTRLGDWNAPEIDVAEVLDKLKTMKSQIDKLDASIVKHRMKQVTSIATLVDDLTVQITDRKKATKGQVDLVDRLVAQLIELSE